MDLPHLTSADVIPDQPLTPEEEALQAKRRRIFRRIAVILITLVILFTIIGFVTARHWLRQTMSDSLPPPPRRRHPRRDPRSQPTRSRPPPANPPHPRLCRQRPHHPPPRSTPPPR